MIDCTLVTCEKVGDLDPDDRLLMHELQARGLTVSIETWSDPHAKWGSSRLCIVRSTWDYHERYDEFIAWVEHAASLTVLKNDPQVLRWNAHKSYLKELEQAGVPIVPTAWAARGEPCDLAQLAEARGWHDMVLKPATGAAAHQVTLVRRDAASFAAGQAQFGQLAQTQDVLVQPYLRSVMDWAASRYQHVKKQTGIFLFCNLANQCKRNQVRQMTHQCKHTIMFDSRHFENGHAACFPSCHHAPERMRVSFGLAGDN